MDMVGEGGRRAGIKGSPGEGVVGVVAIRRNGVAVDSVSAPRGLGEKDEVVGPEDMEIEDDPAGIAGKGGGDDWSPCWNGWLYLILPNPLEFGAFLRGAK